MRMMVVWKRKKREGREERRRDRRGKKIAVCKGEGGIQSSGEIEMLLHVT